MIERSRDGLKYLGLQSPLKSQADVQLKLRRYAQSQAPFAPFQSFPPHPASPPTRRTHQGRLYGRGSGVLDTFSGFGGGAPHLQSQGKAPRGRGWTFSIKLFTFSGLKFAVSLYFVQTLLRNAKRARGCQNCRKCCFQHKRCSKVTQVFQPLPGQSEMSCVSSSHTETGCGPLGSWGKGTDNISDYDLALSPPQFHFCKDTIKEFIIVFQNEIVLKQPFLTAKMCKQVLMENQSLLRPTTSQSLVENIFWCYVFRDSLENKSIKLRILIIYMFLFYSYRRCRVSFFFQNGICFRGITWFSKLFVTQSRFA